ncbi:hypothetical protein [Jeongeupia sp. HS-3]|uniref:hypothetical protein n=1 Tax=Jeongeupia sp. HS-3 TaxID=1009682 RepID=UPI00191083EE|nr:hypothetical protein [Jeongeupia sp. HS-3]
MIQLSIGGLNADAVTAQVNKALAEQATAARQLSETTAARRKLLSDTIDAANDIDDDTKKSLAGKVETLINHGWSEDQVCELAQAQIDAGHELVAARTLSHMGYAPLGNARIQVPAEGAKKLSGIYRDHLAKTDSAYLLHPDPKAQLHPFCARVLAEFDRLHAPAIEREAKMTDAKRAGYNIGQISVGATHTDTSMTETYIKLRDMPVSEVVLHLPARKAG